MTTELEYLVGTYWIAALQTHCESFVSARTNKLHIHLHFKNPYFRYKLLLAFISNSSPKLIVSCTTMAIK
jgi:hypothetical protein